MIPSFFTSKIRIFLCIDLTSWELRISELLELIGTYIVKKSNNWESRDLDSSLTLLHYWMYIILEKSQVGKWSPVKNKMVTR